MQKTVEVPQWQFIVNVIGIPVYAQRQDAPLRQLAPAVIAEVMEIGAPLSKGSAPPMSLNDIMRATDCREHAFVCGHGNVGKGCSCLLCGSDALVFIADCDPSVLCRRAWRVSK